MDGQKGTLRPRGYLAWSAGTAHLPARVMQSTAGTANSRGIEVMVVKSARTPTRKRNEARKSVFKLSKDTQQLMKKEAQSLGMTPDEYSRLTAHLFATLRKALAQKQAVDGKGLLNIVENPLFGLVIQYMAEQINKSGGDGGSEGKKLEDTSTHEAPRTPRPDFGSPFGAPQQTQPNVPPRPGTIPNQIPIDWDYW